MADIEMLCLAYSMKHGGRCVAGVRLDTFEWIRPVSPAEDGTLTEAACTLDAGRVVKSLDVVKLPLAGARPAQHQPENWVIGEAQWNLVREAKLSDIFDVLDPLCDLGPGLLGTPGKSISWEEVQGVGVRTSLGLVRVDSPRFELNDWNRLRARFTHDGGWYDLSLTAIAPWATNAFKHGGAHPSSSWYLTVSLGEPWEETNRCYKLVAGGLEV